MALRCSRCVLVPLVVILAGLLSAPQTRTATLVLRGLTGVQGVAASPQGLLFVSLARGRG